MEIQNIILGETEIGITPAPVLVTDVFGFISMRNPSDPVAFGKKNDVEIAKVTFGKPLSLGNWSNHDEIEFILKEKGK